MNETFYSRLGKRWLDATLSVLALLVTSPLFLIASIAIRLTSAGPILFRQQRVGRFGKLFSILKFRTMVWNNQDRGSLVTASGDPRITAIGRILRKTKIDEIPQLLNVLRGEMSFVGPRPEVPEFTTTYDVWQKRILAVKPGITGPAAIAFVKEEELLAAQSDKEHFYRTVLIPAKLELDLDYCQNIRLLSDVKLILRTMIGLFEFRKPMAQLSDEPF